MKSNDRLLVAAVSATVLIAFYVSTSNAQGTRSISSTGRRLDEFGKMSDKAARDELNREMQGRKPSPEAIRKAAAVKAEVKEDFESLQNEYNKLVTVLNSKESLNPAFVRETAERIHKHANRLKTNVVFPAPLQSDSEEVKKADSLGDSRKQLRSMCEQIYLFVTNPIFENPNVLDIEAARKAASTLEAIINVSDRLRENP